MSPVSPVTPTLGFKEEMLRRGGIISGKYLAKSS